MYTIQSKKLIIINILDILNKFTDETHRLSQQEIAVILQRDYQMKVERKAIRRNILCLIDFGYDIEYSETVRKIYNVKTKELEDSYILSDFYMERDFTDGELRVIIDSVIYSKSIPPKQRIELIKKVGALSSNYFQAQISHTIASKNDKLNNKQWFLTVELLAEAIENKRQVSFHYNEYNIIKELVPRRNSQGPPREYVINPYQIVVSNGWHYLICNNSEFDDISHYRVDRITDVKLLDSTCLPINKLNEKYKTFDLEKYMAEHIYMFTGEAQTIVFRIKRLLISEVIDYFGKEVAFFDENDTEVSARAKVNVQAMHKWILQYAQFAKIISPKSLADAVKNDLEAACAWYNT